MTLEEAIGCLSELRTWETERVQGIFEERERRNKPLGPADVDLIMSVSELKHQSLQLGIEALRLIQGIRSATSHPGSAYELLPGETHDKENKD